MSQRINFTIASVTFNMRQFAATSPIDKSDLICYTYIPATEKSHDAHINHRHSVVPK